MMYRISEDRYERLGLDTFLVKPWPKHILPGPDVKLGPGFSGWWVRLDLLRLDLEFRLIAAIRKGLIDD